MNSYYFEKGSAISVTDLGNLAAAVEDSWELNITPLVCSDITLDRTVATDLTTDSSGQVVDPGGINGSNAGASMPDNVTLAISFRTALRGRSYRGRVYHVGVARSAVTGDSVGTSNALAYQEQYQAFIADILTAMPGWTHVVVSLCNEGSWRTTGVTTPVTSIQVDPTIDSQRKRLAGRGI
jgi:hypothetical protein